MTERWMNVVAGKLAMALTATLMVMATLTVGMAPSADAQAAPVFATDLVIAPGAQCPTGYANVGTVTESLAGTYCRPDGFGPITSQAVCTEAAVGLGNLTTWIADSGLPTCAINGVVRSGFTDMVCPAPLQNAVGEAPSGLVEDWCLVPVLVFASGAALTAGLPTCIESDNVQNDAVAASLQVGSQYSGSDGVRYLIQSGPPSCSFNCHMGFDVDCDDKLGDFCPVELDRDTVAGTKACLAALATSESVPAVLPVAAAAAPAVQAVAVNSSLAHTGSETTLAAVGTLLIAAGALALGSRRRITRDAS